jgi:hypothetical protein
LASEEPTAVGHFFLGVECPLAVWSPRWQPWLR